MDCVSNKSKKKHQEVFRAPRARGKRASFHTFSSIEEQRAPRARGKRASFHGCSPTAEPTDLDPYKPKFRRKTAADIEIHVHCDSKHEGENETVVLHSPSEGFKLQLDHIGESSTDDVLDDTADHVENQDNSDKENSHQEKEDIIGDSEEKSTEKSELEETGVEIDKTKVSDSDNDSIEIDKLSNAGELDLAEEKVDPELGNLCKSSGFETELESVEKCETDDKNFEAESNSRRNSITEVVENLMECKKDLAFAESDKVLDANEPVAELLNSENKSKSDRFEGGDNDFSAVGDKTDSLVKETVEELLENRSRKNSSSEVETTVADMDRKKKIQDDDNNLESDDDIQFVARHDSNDEITDDLDDTKGTDGEKSGMQCEIEDDVRDHVQGGSQQTFAAFSKYVDRVSIMEDIKDEAYQSGDMEAGDDVLVHYMKRNHTKQLKTSLRNGTWGLTSEVRQTLWYNLCHYLHKADDTDMFSEFAEDLFAPGEYTELGIPSFVDMQHLNSYHLSPKGIHTAKQILCVLGHSCPDIIYSPVLFSILSLFLHYMDRSQCYNSLYSLLRHKDSSFLPTTKVSYEASKLVMRDLAKKYAKSGYVYLVRNCGNIDQVFDSWIWWIFEDLPMIFLVRVIDCYLQEGIKIFYRISLAILILFSKMYTKKSSPKKGSTGGNVLIALRQFCREMPVPVHKLLKTSFGIKGLSRNEIRKLQVKHEMFVNSTKNVSSFDSQPGSKMTMSRSFSGPMILQNLGTDNITVDMLYALLTWLPTRYAICQPELLYTSEEHGTSLVTLYQRVENYQPTVIIIKTTKDEVFGAFCSTYWRERRQKGHLLSYFGTGETFIFTLAPEKKKYEWVGLTQENIPNTASMFQAGDRNILTVGGGHGEAIYLDETMLHCRSERCDTFNNEPLCESEDFVCKVVEVYGFQ